VSKLGFDLEEETKQAIIELKYLIKELAIERIMVELDKIMRGPYHQKAYQYLVETKVHTVLFGLEKGIEYMSTHDVSLYPLEVFILSFIVGEESDIWRFSNKDYRLIGQVLNLHEATKEDVFNKFIVFSNGVEVCLITNKINVALGYKDQEALIKQLDSELLVKDVCDLKFKGQDILQLTNLKKRSVIALVIDDLLYNVIMEIMPNDYETLKAFALKRIDELQKDMERS
jgi:tRNA nucleotidyltransferase (CCA-adding enzyme)